MDSFVRAYEWNLLYAEALVADLSHDEWVSSGGPGLENHPAWTLGHLVTGSDMLAEDLGLERDLPDGWAELFERRGPGDPRLPSSDPDVYPSKEEVLGELRRQHERVAKAWLDATPQQLETPIEWRFDSRLPRVSDVTVFLAISHEAMHLGQLAAWRRAKGLPSALAAMA